MLSRQAVPPIPDDLVERLYRRAEAGRWSLPRDVFARALQASAERALAGHAQTSASIARYLETLHAADVALACACASGHEAAWDHFVLEYRPILYRAADALDARGGARDLADALYAELYGVADRWSSSGSLFRYYHGRSSLATWLRAVLSQRFVDRIRATQRLDPLQDEEPIARPSASRAADPDRSRYLALMQLALTAATGALAARDRLRLDLYYAQQMTLAQIGRMLGEHEATVSRQLARTRRDIRRAMERYLSTEGGLSDEQMARCFESTMEDPGSIDLGRAIGRKESGPERSIR
jgi:RNA polymerase sigma-70 factor (ECF subfamily)